MPTEGMSNEGTVVSVKGNGSFQFLWTGAIAEVKSPLLLRYAHKLSGLPSPSGREWLTCDLACRKCGQSFGLGDLYYNRKGPASNKKSRYYCLVCAEMLGFIKRVESQG